MKDLDAWHVEYFQIIQHFVIRYWNDHGRLPSSLRDVLVEALRKLHKNPTPQQIALLQMPRDPGTGVSYEYKITGDHSFELCANVEQDTRAMEMLGMPNNNVSIDQINSGKHKTLHICFSCAIVEAGD
jgi:hypothetical protein